MTRFRRLLLLTLLLLLLAGGGLYLFRYRILAQRGIYPSAGDPAPIEPSLPDGFTGHLFAGDLARPRFMTVGPDGTLFVAEFGKNRVIALPDRDGDGEADERVVIAEGLDRPSSLLFRPGTQELYVGETTRVTRLVLDELDLLSQEVIIPDLTAERGHVTTTILFGADGRLYVSMGSSCNVCEEKDPRLAAVWVYGAEGGQGQPYMVGLRNAVGLALHPETGEIWATNNGRDLMGNELPPETLYILEEGADAGWPRCHAARIPDPDFGREESSCEGVAAPVLEMPAHSAPLGLTFYDGELFPPDYRGDLFVAYHGSWNRMPPTGYKIVRVPIENGRVAGEIEDFATGWLREDLSSPGRPVGLTVAADGALLVSDDKAGLIYRIVPSD